MTSLVRVSHGLSLPPELLQDELDRMTALLSLCDDHAVIAGRSAARLHGLWMPDHGDARLEVIVHPDNPCLTNRPHSRRHEIWARRQRVRDDEVTMVSGLPVLTEARTWVGLGGRLSAADLISAGDSVLRGRTGSVQLHDAVERARRHRGVIQARAALPHLDPRSRSRAESHLRWAIVGAGLPSPEVNVPIVTADGEWLGEPDLSYRDVRLAIEYNGADHAGVTRMRRDITRELDFEDRGGWRTVVFGPAEVFGRPHLVPITVSRLRRQQSSGAAWC